MSLQVKCLILSAALAVGFTAGWQAQGWRKDAELLQVQQVAQKAAQVARDAVAAQEAAVDLAQRTAAELAVEKRREAKIVERVITNDVIKYVQTSGAGRCGVDGHGVRIIDAAASGRMPEDPGTAGTPDGGAGDATAGEVVASVTGNYAICHETRQQLVELQGWVRGIFPGQKHAASH